MANAHASSYVGTGAGSASECARTRHQTVARSSEWRRTPDHWLASGNNTSCAEPHYVIKHEHKHKFNVNAARCNALRRMAIVPGGTSCSRYLAVRTFPRSVSLLAAPITMRPRATFNWTGSRRHDRMVSRLLVRRVVLAFGAVHGSDSIGKERSR